MTKETQVLISQDYAAGATYDVLRDWYEVGTVAIRAALKSTGTPIRRNWARLTPADQAQRPRAVVQIHECLERPLPGGRARPCVIFGVDSCAACLAHYDVGGGLQQSSGADLEFYRR